MENGNTIHMPDQPVEMLHSAMPFKISDALTIHDWKSEGWNDPR
jgi:hypothetical protein